MRANPAAVFFIASLLPVAAQAQTPAAPDLDCSLGFDGLHAMTASLPGAQSGHAGSTSTVTTELPDVWRVQYAFTTPGQAAHPAVTLRTFYKQVTGVWTAQSKGCGFGDQRQFTALMADMKAIDTDMTNASRAEVDRQEERRFAARHALTENEGRYLCCAPALSYFPDRTATVM